MIGENVKRYRMSLDLTQEELAELAEIDSSMVCKIETGAANPSIPTLQKLAIVFKCEVEDLVRINKEAV